jgi:SAM-dependent methyltransferase
MGQLLEIVTPLHKATKRDYLQRMQDEKVHCMQIAKQYGKDYWDGDRRYGYGGYKYIPGRWKPVAEELIENYKLASGSKVLDVGCGKGFLLYEMKLLQPELEITGFDISLHGLENAKDEIKPDLHKAKAEDKFNYEDNAFDLVISLGTLHNLRIFNLRHALSEMNRVAKQQYMMVESYRNEQELFNLQCWALTCESFFDTEEWIWLFEQFGYSGDYEFIYF